MNPEILTSSLQSVLPELILAGGAMVLLIDWSLWRQSCT